MHASSVERLLPSDTDVHARIAASFRAQSLMQTLGAELVHVGTGEVHIALPFGTHLLQQQGFVHAGALTSIADSACGYAALTTAPPDREIVSVEFKINLVRPGIGARFLAIGTVQNAGRTLTVCSAEVRAFDTSGEDFKVIALMQATMMTVPR
jgi:uncharacterized protein (TIGR00369 family)